MLWRAGRPRSVQIPQLSFPVRDSAGSEKPQVLLNSIGRLAHRRAPFAHSYLRCLQPGSFFEVPPMSAVAFQQFVSLSWPPGAGWIVGKVSGRQSFPNIQSWADHTPTSFDHVGALE